MKKTVLILILFLFFANNIHSQIGVKVGVSLSGLLSSNSDDFRPLLGNEIDWIQYGESRPIIGIQLGVFYRIKISDYFDFQPEINFVQRGYYFDQTPLYDTRYKVEINYIELPLIIKYKVPISTFNLNFCTGSFAAIKLSANRELVYEGRQDIKPLNSVENFDFGIVAGLGSDINLGSGQVVLELRANYGLYNMMVQPENYIDLYEEPIKVKNVGLALTTGYRFNIID